MINKAALATVGLFLGSGILLLTSGMSSQNFLADLAFQQHPKLHVVGGVERAVLDAHPGAALRFEVVSCAGGAPLRSVALPFQTQSLQTYRAFSATPVRLEAAHRFTDITWQVAPGCYQVRAHLVDAGGQALGQCHQAGTPSTFLEANQTQDYALILNCDPAHPPRHNAGVVARGRLNHPPTLDPLALSQPDSAAACSASRVCATARDRDAHPMEMYWSVRDQNGRRVPIAQPNIHIEKSAQASAHTECIVLPAEVDAADVAVTVRDLDTRHARRAVPDTPLSFEDRYLADFGLVIESRDQKSLSVHNRCTPDICPEDPAARIQNIKYWISRDDTLLAPTTDLSQVRQGDTVDVQFDVAPGCEQTRLTFASYYREDNYREDNASGGYESRLKEAAKKGAAPGRPASIFSRYYSAGTHLLWNMLPECRFQIELRLDTSSDASGGADQAYHLIDAYSGGSADCPRP